MASILEIYKEKSKGVDFTGNIKIPSDLTPYSVGAGTKSDETKLGDEKAISALETKLSVNRYGSGFLPDTADAKNYSQVVKKD